MHYRLWTYTQGNSLKRMAAFMVPRLLYHCEYFIPISNLCVSLRLGTVGSYRQSDRTAWTSAWSCWSHSKATLWGLFEVRAMVTAKCVVVIIQRGPKSWVEGMDAAISSGWGISQHLHLTGQRTYIFWHDRHYQLSYISSPNFLTLPLPLFHVSCGLSCVC